MRAIHRIWFEHFYVPLSSMEGVIVVQAAVTSSQILREKDPDYFADCAILPNRIRVVAFSAENTGLSLEGANWQHLFVFGELNADACTDLYINGGIWGDREIPFELHDFQKAP